MKRMAAILAGLILMTAGSAWAFPTLTLTSGSSTVTVTDGGVNDSSAAVGSVVFVGTIGDWVLNVSTGISPAGPGVPNLHLNSVDITARSASSSPTTIAIKLSDTITSAWTGPGANVNVGGTLNTGATATFETLINGTSFSLLGPYTAGAFSGTDSFDYISGSPVNDTIDLIASITHTVNGTSSFDHEIVPTPEPGTFVLLGAGLLGLGVYGRRRIQK